MTETSHRPVISNTASATERQAAQFAALPRRAPFNPLAQWQLWIWGFAVSFATTLVSFKWLDMPVVRAFAVNANSLAGMGDGLSSSLLLSGEAVLVLTLVGVRLVQGRLPMLAKALVIASLASICAYAVNDNVLKLVFGVPNPSQSLAGMPHALHWFAGSTGSSFPSGHMMLAGGFAGVMMRLYPRWTWPLAGLLGLASAALLAGGWHFVSDVVAGTFLGVSAGVLAGKLWQSHAG